MNSFPCRLFFTLILLSCLCTCSKKNDQSCITLQSPTGNNVSVIDTKFSWTTCTTGQNTCYLLKDYAVIDSVTTFANTFTYSKTLLANNTYQWYVKHNGEYSNTTTFTTTYPDSLFVGSYSVIASYHAHQSFGGSPGFDTVYGPTTITIVKKSNGVLTVRDAPLLNRTFDVAAEYERITYDSLQIFYGSYYSSYIIYKYQTHEILVSDGFMALGGSAATQWAGTKN
jgi:hypothetical protein